MASPYVFTKHDIGVTNTDSVITGMMLAEKNGAPRFAVFDDEYLAAQYFSGEPGYGNLPPEKELAIRQDDWRSGFGLDFYDPLDSKRYYSSKGMDMRFRGMGLGGYQATSIQTNGTLYVSPTNFVDSDGLWSGETNVYDEDTSTLARCNTAPSSWSSFLELSHAALNINAIRFWHSNASITQVNIGLYYNSTWNVLYADVFTDGAWVVKGVSPSQAVTAVRLKFYNNAGTWQNANLNEVDFGQVNDSAQKFEEFNDILYIASGVKIKKLSTTGSAFNAVNDFTANITDLKTFPDDKLYIALGTSTAHQVMNTAEGFPSPGAGVNTFELFETVLSATPTMWGNDAVNKIRSNATPNNAASWSAQTTVDANYHNITDLISQSGALYIMKENRPYYLNSSGAVQANLAPELESLTRSTSGKNVHLWKNKLYIPCGLQGLLETDGTTNKFLNPSLYCTNLSTFVGRVMAVASDEEYLYVAVDNGSQVEILAGREETIDSTTAWVWHPIAELTITDVETMHVSTIYQKRLWIASTDALQPLYYIPLPTGYGDIINDANRSFQANVFVETSYLHGNFRDTTKTFSELSVLMGHAYNANLYFSVYYKTLSNTTYTFIANYVGSATSMRQTNYLPDAGTGHPVDTHIRLKFIAQTPYTDKTPVLLGYNLKGILYPSQREIFACTVKAYDEVTLKDGTVDKSGSIIRVTLNEARKATYPISIRDIDGNTKTVKFLPIPSPIHRWELVRDEKSRKLEKIYNILMLEVKLS